MANLPKCPHCPMCGEPPMMVMGGGTQAFCATDDCEMFTWDPSVSAAQNLANAQRIEITPSIPESPDTEKDQDR
jgi:hypothetical protein